MKDKGTLILIGILVLVGGVLGYAIYQSGALKKGQAPTTAPAISTTQATDTSLPTRTLTAEEQEVLKFPGPDASEEEIKRHGELVDQLSEGATLLDITNCSPFPVVTLVNPSTTITVRNSGFTEQTIVRADKAVAIPAGGEVQVTISSLTGSDLGNLGYSCQGVPGPVGVFQVAPESL